MTEFNIQNSKIDQLNNSGDNIKTAGRPRTVTKAAKVKAATIAHGANDPSKPVFISHASKDKLIVDAFVDLLVHAGVPVGDIFCSSLEGMGIPPGQKFIDHIKTQIQRPKLVVLMLSRNYYDSLFCTCELGASWAMSQEILPIIIPPASFADMKAVLTGYEAIKINDSLKLTEAYEIVVNTLGIRTIPAVRWEVKRDAFLRKAAPLLRKQQPPTRVAFSELEALTKKHEELLKEYKNTESANSTLQDQVNLLKQQKDAVAVAAVMKKYSSAWDEFEAIKKKATTAVGKLTAIVKEALFRHQTGSPKKFSGSGTWEALQDAQEKQYLSLDDELGAVELNTTDPTINEAITATDAMREFLEVGGSDTVAPRKISRAKRKKDEAFYEEFTTRHGYTPSFKSRRFWNDHLGLSRLYA